VGQSPRALIEASRRTPGPPPAVMPAIGMTVDPRNCRTPRPSVRPEVSRPRAGHGQDFQDVAGRVLEEEPAPAPARVDLAVAAGAGLGSPGRAGAGRRRGREESKHVGAGGCSSGWGSLRIRADRSTTWRPDRVLARDRQTSAVMGQPYRASSRTGNGVRAGRVFGRHLRKIKEPGQTPNLLRRWEPAVPYWQADT
jgi:hypothetical protein